jgi:glycosyltransferase 2 family protein
VPPPFTPTPRLLRRGLEIFALISVAGVIGLLFYGNNFPLFISTILHLKWEWMVVGLALASMDWVGGGFRLWVVTRHVHPGVRLGDMILAAGMGAWGSYVTPFQAGSSPMAIWRMAKAGVRVPEAMTSVFITFVATVAFLATAGPLAIIFGAGRSLAEHGILLGITLFDLFKTSLTAFVLIGVAMFAAIVFPRAVRNFVHRVAVTLGRRNARVGARMELLSAGIDRAHDCMVAFRSPKGLLTLVWAIIISGPSHANKLLAGYVALRALGIHADFVDVLLLQTFISFMLYFAPTPGASGFAEVISSLVMSIYVTDAALIPAYILIWRFINSYATVAVGTALFWSWLRRGLIGKEEAVAT